MVKPRLVERASSIYHVMWLSVGIANSALLRGGLNLKNDRSATGQW